MGQIGLPLQCQTDSAGRGGDDDADSRDSSPERLVLLVYCNSYNI